MNWTLKNISIDAVYMSNGYLLLETFLDFIKHFCECNQFSKLNVARNDMFDTKKLATHSKLEHPTKIIKQNSQLSCLYFALCPTQVICHSQIKMCFSNFSVQFYNKKNPHLSCIHLSLSNHTWSGNQKRTEWNLTLEVVCWQLNQPNCIKQRHSYLQYR